MIATLRSEIRLLDVMRSLFLNQGYVEKLERELTEYFGVENSLLTHSCRTGIYFLLKALPQKKVYLPAYNCWAVTEAAMYAGKEIEYVDISLNDYNMDIAKLRACLVPDAIILATHQFGIPCDIEAIMELARERNCVVLEDNAAAFGAEVGGKKTGSFGSAGVLSFDYSKTVVSGKGGAILFNDAELYRKVRAVHDKEVRRPALRTSLKFMLLALAYSYATHRLAYPLTYAVFKRIRGSSRSAPAYDLTPGNGSYTLAFDDGRAKLAHLNMKRLGSTMARRILVNDFYRGFLACCTKIVSPELRDGVTAAMVKLPIRLKGADRQHFYDNCVEKGLDLAFLFQFHYSGNRDDCPNARIAADEAMGLPVYGSLSSRDLNKMKSIILDEKNYLAPARNGAELAEKRRLLFLSINYYWMDTASFLRSGEMISLLRTCDALPEQEYSLRIVYKTFLVDLSKSKDEIFSGFDYTRAVCPIKKAIKGGVVVKRAETAGEKLRYYDFYRAFAEDPKRKNRILVVQRGELDRLEIMYAVAADGEYLGGIGLLPSTDGRYLLAKYSATLHRCCEQDLLVWHAIQYAKDAGFSFFDLSWMLPSEDQNSQQYRLFQYKKKFGGDLVDFYSYVSLKGPCRMLGFFFQTILRHLFHGDIDRFALFLKKMTVFK